MFGGPVPFGGLSTFGGFWAQAAQSLKSFDSLALQAIVVPHSKTTEGTLIEAVAPVWFEIARWIQADTDCIFRISPEKMEELIAGSYKRDGFDEVILTPRSGDGGKDVIAVKHGFFTVKIIDQVKRYAPGHLVTVDEVGSLLNVLTQVERNATHGVITTTSDFAPRLKSDARVTPFLPDRLKLINGKALLSRLESLAGG